MVAAVSMLAAESMLTAENIYLEPRRKYRKSRKSFSLGHPYTWDLRHLKEVLHIPREYFNFIDNASKKA